MCIPDGSATKERRKERRNGKEWLEMRKDRTIKRNGENETKLKRESKRKNIREEKK